jgi:hypothetical protein
METAVHGAQKWQNNQVVDRRLQRFASVAPSNEPLELGWSPFTSVLCIGANDDHLGLPIPFSSNTWGGRHAFQALIRPWLQKGRHDFPICTLASRLKKNDANANVDPLFKIVGWAPRSDFAEFLPPDDEPPPTSEGTARVDDDVPF